MKALCFDQATTATGWAAGATNDPQGAFEFGTIRIPKRENFGERLAFLHAVGVKLIEMHKPDMIGFEEPFFPVDRGTFKPGGQAFTPAKGFLPAEIDQDQGGGAAGARFNPETVKQLQMVKGVIITLAALYSIPVEGPAPSQWRKTVLGYGRAPKGAPADHMKTECRKRMRALGYDCSTTDEAEALGILMHLLHGPKAAKRAQGDLLAMAAGRL